MRILLILPASGHWKHIASTRRREGKTFRFSVLGLLTVAALSPEDASVRIVDEQHETVPEEHFDLVGITAMTALAPRAYELCDRFRAAGIPVVMGGFHASLNPEEALEHADAVVIGHAYGAWEQVCKDVKNGRLERVYHGDAEASPPIHLPRHLLSPDRYLTRSSTFATLGCTNGCKFCSINVFHRGERFERPVEDVAAELARLPKELTVFVDDNLTQSRQYSLQLLSAIEPLKRRWVIQASISVGEDPELLRAMARAGCIGVFVGLETFSSEALKAQDKAFNLPERYREAVRAFHQNGIFVQAGVMVGFDTDGPEVFRETLRMLEWVGIDAIQLAILTPIPGTPLHESMRERIVDRNLEHYDYRNAVFTPARMSREELQAGSDWLIRAYYSHARVLRRLLRWWATPHGLSRFVYPLGLNLAYLKRVRLFGIRGSDPARTARRSLARDAPIPAGRAPRLL
jgi:radical SAM superfamily enzyme YgiQ (UPF0313 family)